MYGAETRPQGGAPRDADHGQGGRPAAGRGLRRRGLGLEIWPGAPASRAAPFRTDPVERGRQARTAPELVSVRTVEHEGYDRVLFTFRGAAPGYQVGYVPEVADQAGRPLPLRGRAFLAVSFEPARAHDPGGASTVATGTTLTPGSPVLRQVRLAGDFEGRVSFGIGLAGRDGFRVSELRDPTRVAVDVR